MINKVLELLWRGTADAEQTPLPLLCRTEGREPEHPGIRAQPDRPRPDRAGAGGPLDRAARAREGSLAGRRVPPDPAARRAGVHPVARAAGPLRAGPSAAAAARRKAW